MLKMRLGMPEVAGSPQAEGAYGLRYCGLDPGPQGVGADELGRLLTLSRRLQGEVLVARPEGHDAPHRSRAGAVGPVSTSPAVLGGELHLDDGRPAIIDETVQNLGVLCPPLAVVGRGPDAVADHA